MLVIIALPYRSHAARRGSAAVQYAPRENGMIDLGKASEETKGIPCGMLEQCHPETHRG